MRCLERLKALETGGFKSNNKKDISYVKDALDRVFNLRLDLEASGLQMDVRVLNCLVSACGRAAAFEELRSDAPIAL